MRKLYAMMAAALMSVSLFATPENVPTLQDLAAKYDVANKVVLCCYFDVAPCNPVVLAGSYNDWSSDPTKCLVFESLANFEGWFAVEIENADGLQVRPLQLNDNSFDGWDYGAAYGNDGDAWSLLGTAEATITSSGYGDEANVSFPANGAYIYEVAKWKNGNNPCGEVKIHKYTLILLPPDCDETEFDFEPAIAGAFNDWAVQAMDVTLYQGLPAYSYVVETAEGKEFKFLEYNLGWSNEFEWFNAEDESWNQFGNQKFKEADTEEVEWVFDYSDNTKYRYAQCGVEIADVVINFKAPAGAPAEGVELMGSFIGGKDFGEGVLMELNDGIYTATVQATESQEFKFRKVDDWDVQIEIYDGDEEAWKTANNFSFGEFWEDADGGKVLNIDLSDAELYRWTPTESGVEDVVLTVSAQKVVVDGVLYIVRDNKLFTVQGTQVR